MDVAIACGFKTQQHFARVFAASAECCIPSAYDVAKHIDRGVAALDGCSRLIVDLRGNTGGGIGGYAL